jgi:hypothetical protein
LASLSTGLLVDLERDRSELAGKWFKVAGKLRKVAGKLSKVADKLSKGAQNPQKPHVKAWSKRNISKI